MLMPYLCLSFFWFRLLGMMDLSLREVVLKGKHSVNSALKSKKGELLLVGTMYVALLLYRCSKNEIEPKIQGKWKTLKC